MNVVVAVHCPPDRLTVDRVLEARGLGTTQLERTHLDNLRLQNLGISPAYDLRLEYRIKIFGIGDSVTPNSNPKYDYQL